MAVWGESGSCGIMESGVGDVEARFLLRNHLLESLGIRAGRGVWYPDAPTDYRSDRPSGCLNQSAESDPS